MSVMDVTDYVMRAPQSTLEKMYIELYLLSKGYCLEDLKELTQEEASRLMEEACTDASLRLAEVESKALYRQKIIFAE